jgi:hypothetical protein
MDNKHVYVEGDKTGFNSKTALQKFKETIRKDPNVDFQKYIKPNYELNLVETTAEYVKYTINLKNETKQFSKKQMFQAKLKLLADKRTNINIKNLSFHKDIVPPEITTIYKKLVKTTHTPIPEPYEILKNPEQYKPFILQVLRTNMDNTNQLYLNYFKLLAKQVGLMPTNIPNANLVAVNEPKLNSNDTDTDEAPELVSN